MPTRRGRAGSAGGAAPEVVLYTAEGCHLCDRARETLAGLRDELRFELAEVDITGDPALEERHREWLPVVEIGGERALVYHVVPEAFRARLAQARARAGRL